MNTECTINNWPEILELLYPLYSCVMASSAMEFQLGVYSVFVDYTCRNKRKQIAPTICALRVAFHACLSFSSDSSTYAPDESWLFWSWEKNWIPKTGAPNGARSGISGLYLWYNLKSAVMSMWFHSDSVKTLSWIIFMHDLYRTSCKVCTDLTANFR